MARRPLILIFLASLLSSCAYTMNKSVQEVRVETPGTKGAKCFVSANGVRHVVHPPNSIHLTKGQDDLAVRCLAPGNREREVFVKPTIETSTFFAGPIIPATLGWDYTSGALYKYPDLVTVDFTHMPVRPQPMPMHNHYDVKQPEEYDREEYIPSRPVLNSDKYNAKEFVLQRREFGGDELFDEGDFGEEMFPNSVEDVESLDKADLSASLDLDEALSMDGDSDGGDGDGPIPLYPGE